MEGISRLVHQTTFKRKKEGKPLMKRIGRAWSTHKAPETKTFLSHDATVAFVLVLQTVH